MGYDSFIVRKKATDSKLLPIGIGPPLIHSDYEHPLWTPLTLLLKPEDRYKLMLDRIFEGKKVLTCRVTMRLGKQAFR